MASTTFDIPVIKTTISTQAPVHIVSEKLASRSVEPDPLTNSSRGPSPPRS